MKILEFFSSNPDVAHNAYVSLVLLNVIIALIFAIANKVLHGFNSLLPLYSWFVIFGILILLSGLLRGKIIEGLTIAVINFFMQIMFLLLAVLTIDTGEDLLLSLFPREKNLINPSSFLKNLLFLFFLIFMTYCVYQMLIPAMMN